MTKRRVLVVHDNDGTLRKIPHEGNSTWSVLDRAVLDEHHLRWTQVNREFFVKRKKRQGLTKADEVFWLDQSVHALVECRLNRAHLDTCFSNGDHDRLREGFVEYFQWLNKARSDVEVIPVINSYGFVDVIERMLHNVGARALVKDICAMEMMFDQTGTLTGYKPESLIVTEIKAERTAMLMERYGVPLRDVAGIGDSDGDKNIVPEGGKKLLLAFDDKQVTTYQSCFTHAVVSHDFSGAKDWLQAHFGL